jgi:uracil phosphoribosyltransferase
MLRDKKTKTGEFRRYSDRIMTLLIEEAIATQLGAPERRMSPTGEEYDHYSMKYEESEYCAVSIIRAGDSMIGPVFEMMPDISCGKVLVQRDEDTAEPIFFYQKFPDNLEDKKHFFVLDPMLATGGSCSLTISNLVKLGVQPKNITFINLVSCEKGLARLISDHPEIKIITAAVDPTLDSKSYILPGLGDYGDRYFGSRLPK